MWHNLVGDYLRAWYEAHTIIILLEQLKSVGVGCSMRRAVMGYCVSKEGKWLVLLGWCVTVSVIKSFGQLRVSDDIGYGHIYSQSDKTLVSYGGGLSDIPQFHCLLQRDQRLEHSQFRSGVSDVWYICDYQTQVIHYGGCFYLAQVRCPFPPWSAGGRHQLLFSMLREQW